VEEWPGAVDDTPKVVEGRDFPEILGKSLLRALLGTA
jgi:hypothetical protein